MKKILVRLILVLLLIPMVSAAAAEDTGSIRLRLEVGDLPVINGAVTLYQVGIKVEDGYRITEAFGGGIVRKADADSEKLALWLEAM